MKKLLLTGLLLITLSLSAQEYSWQWATRGGGIKNAPSESANGYSFTSEQVNDVAVDQDNNYYFLAYMTQQDTEYEGTALVSYNAPAGNSGGMDLVLISTTCDGTFRWTQTIGGAGNDFGYKLGLDNSGGLYLTANVTNLSGPSQTYAPPHFSPDVALPVLDGTGQAQEGYKSAAVIKYNTADGSLAWYKMLQGSVDYINRASIVGDIVIDGEGNLRVLVGFLHGDHLGGLVTVPETFTNTTKFFIVKISPEGEYLNVTDLPMEGVIEQSQTYFRYDESLNRYYIAGFRTYPGTVTLMPLSYGGTAFTKCIFVLAIDEQGNELWRKEETISDNSNSTWLHSLTLDDDSNFYISGKFFHAQGMSLSFSNYTFPEVMGNVVFVLKMNPQGNVLWGSTPDTETSANVVFDVAVNGDEIALATEMFQETWDEVSINRGNNYLTDPVVLRLHKDTGVAFALHDVMGPFGSKESFTAIATDNDGNYITGGYFRNRLFTEAEDGVDTLEKVGGVLNYTDFFMAKLAASPCGIPAGVAQNSVPRTTVYPNPVHNVLYIKKTTGAVRYEVLSLLGQRLLEGDLSNAQDGINMEQLQSGTYLVNIISTEGKISAYKVIKN